MKYIAVAAERNRKKMNENSRKSITWSAVPYTPLLVSEILAIQLVLY